jgi:hypothetical protein
MSEMDQECIRIKTVSLTHYVVNAGCNAILAHLLKLIDSHYDTMIRQKLLNLVFLTFLKL